MLSAGSRIVADNYTQAVDRIASTLTTIIAVVGAIILTVMFTTSWSSTGRSTGMRLLGLRLIGRDGSTIGPGRSFLRAVAYIVFPLGLCWSAVSARNASVQDLLFGTSVIYDWRMHVPAARTDERADDADAA
jgi:uncharacterized RDD family membrane protein YckC